MQVELVAQLDFGVEAMLFQVRGKKDERLGQDVVLHVLLHVELVAWLAFGVGAIAQDGAGDLAHAGVQLVLAVAFLGHGHREQEPGGLDVILHVLLHVEGAGDLAHAGVQIVLAVAIHGQGLREHEPDGLDVILHVVMHVELIAELDFGHLAVDGLVGLEVVVRVARLSVGGKNVDGIARGSIVGKPFGQGLVNGVAKQEPTWLDIRLVELLRVDGKTPKAGEPVGP